MISVLAFKCLHVFLLCVVSPLEGDTGPLILSAWFRVNNIEHKNVFNFKDQKCLKYKIS